MRTRHQARTSHPCHMRGVHSRRGVAWPLVEGAVMSRLLELTGSQVILASWSGVAHSTIGRPPIPAIRARCRFRLRKPGDEIAHLNLLTGLRFRTFVSRPLGHPPRQCRSGPLPRRSHFLTECLDACAVCVYYKVVESLLIARKKVGSDSYRPRRGAVVARQAHNLEVTGSNPVAATFRRRC